MSDPERWQERYHLKNTPWDTGRPDSNLINIVTEKPVKTCKCMEIGCGLGRNAIWLARHNFRVTGVDISETAIKKAVKNASDAHVECNFVVADFLNEKISNRPFEFVFDRGCFHSFDSDEDRRKFAENVADHLDKQGLWLSLLGSADDPPRDVGPPRRSALDIVTATEPLFEILCLKAIYFDSNRPTPPRAWSCVMKKR